MRSLLTTLTALLILFLVETSNADKQVPPVGSVVSYEGENLKCFTLEEYRRVAIIFIDYSNLFESNLRNVDTISLLNSKVALLEKKVTLVESVSSSWKSLALLNKGLLDTQVLEQAKKDRLASLRLALPWVLVVVESVALGVVGVTAAAR